jgi:hypothetical protein
MIRAVRVALWLAFLVGCTSPSPPHSDETRVPSGAGGQDLIATVQLTSVAVLDSTMPNIPLESWLATLVEGPVSWEANDCGEGGDGREAPTCVEAILALRGDTTAHLSVIAADLEGRQQGPPAVWNLSVGTGSTFTGYASLREWAERVKRR